jgi:hypothetical protein
MGRLDGKVAIVSVGENPLENPAFLTAAQEIFPGLRAQGALALGDPDSMGPALS